MDPKLARGIARRMGVDFDSGTAESREPIVEAILSGFLGGYERVQAGKRVEPKTFNVPCSRAMNALKDNKGVLHAEHRLFKPRGEGSFTVLRMRRERTWRYATVEPYETDGWLVNADHVGVYDRIVTWRRWTVPTIIDQHLIERYLERSGTPAYITAANAPHGSLRGVLLDAITVVGSLVHRIAWEQGTDNGIMLVPIAIPVPGGVVLGGTDLVLSKKHFHFREFIANGEDPDFAITRSALRARQFSAGSDLQPMTTLKTFVNDALLSREQRDGLAAMRDWLDRRGAPC